MPVLVQESLSKAGHAADRVEVPLQSQNMRGPVALASLQMQLLHPDSSHLLAGSHHPNGQHGRHNLSEALQEDDRIPTFYLATLNP